MCCSRRRTTVSAGEFTERRRNVRSATQSTAPVAGRLWHVGTPATKNSPARRAYSDLPQSGWLIAKVLRPAPATCSMKSRMASRALSASAPQLRAYSRAIRNHSQRPATSARTVKTTDARHYMSSRRSQGAAGSGASADRRTPPVRLSITHKPLLFWAKALEVLESIESVVILYRAPDSYEAVQDGGSRRRCGRSIGAFLHFRVREEPVGRLGVRPVLARKGNGSAHSVAELLQDIREPATKPGVLEGSLVDLSVAPSRRDLRGLGRCGAGPVRAPQHPRWAGGLRGRYRDLHLPVTEPVLPATARNQNLI